MSRRDRPARVRLCTSCRPAVAAGLCAVVLATALRAQTAAGGRLLVLSKADHTLSAVDPATLKVTGRAPSGPDPHEVVVSGDGRIAYISNYNGGGNTISVVDLRTMTPAAAIDLGALRAPHGLAVAGGKLWFTAEGAKAIGSYDPAASRIDWILGTGQDRTHMIHVSADLSRIVTTNVSSATVTIAEKVAGVGRGAPGRGAPGRGPGGPGGATSEWKETVVPVGPGAEGFDVSRDGKEIWTANAQDGTISIVDVAAKRVTATLAAHADGANRLRFTPDGTLALVSTLRGPDLVILDAATRREVTRLPVGHGAAGIEMQPDGLRAFVACTPDNYVAVIDLKSLAVAGHIDAGGQPDGLAWAASR